MPIDDTVLGGHSEGLGMGQEHMGHLQHHGDGGTELKQGRGRAASPHDGLKQEVPCNSPGRMGFGWLWK